mgnify:CR=1 FL=1
MKRISLRIVAIDKAIHGADFVEVFRFFIEAGQSPTDSFTSSQRVFRGVPLGGGAAFTKDTVYLHGLLAVHTFFRWALKHGKLRLCRMLFAGKMTLADKHELEKRSVERVFARLPNGDGFQYAIATYASQGGQVLEARGVIPDEPVTPTRAELLAGRDPVLERALAWIQRPTR